VFAVRPATPTTRSRSLSGAKMKVRSFGMILEAS
jgi:hypothetical protein